MKELGLASVEALAPPCLEEDIVGKTLGFFPRQVDRWCVCFYC